MEREIQGLVLQAEDGWGVAGVIVDIHEAPPNISEARGGPDSQPVRLGSVSTAADGSFEFQWNDSQWPGEPGALPRVRGALVLTVSIDLPNGDTPNHAGRVLAVSSPRAGRSLKDEFVIRIPRARLTAAGVKAMRPAAPHNLLSEKDVVARQNQRQKSASLLRQLGGPEIRRRADLRAKGRVFATGLLGRRPRLSGVDGRLFVPAGVDTRDAAAQSIRNGLEALAKKPPRGAVLHLERKDNEVLAKELDAAARSGTGLPADRVSAVLSQSRAGAARGADLIAACRAEHRVQTTLSALATGGEAGADAPAPTASGEQPEFGSSFQAALNRLVEVLHARMDRATGSRPDVASIGTELKREFPLGPADTEAYYDFHSLEVAWQDTWTAALDRATTEAVAELYETAVEVVPPELLPVYVEEALDLESLLMRLSGLIGAAKGLPGYEAPAELLAWIPALAAVWSDIPPDRQQWIADQYQYDQHEPTNRRERRRRERSPSGNEQVREYLESLPDTLAGQLDQGYVPSLGRVGRLLRDIAARLAEPYQFDIFAPDSYNFGVVFTYRQCWKPLTYQVGSLVSSMPLAPGEKRSFTKRRTVKESSARKDVRGSSSTATSGSSNKGRVEADIVDKASTRLDVATNGTVGGDFKMVNFTVGSSAGVSHEAESARTKNNVREAVREAAQEYRDERSVEISSERAVMNESVETGEVSNPNNELTVTYLFYELQRRFEVSEKLHRLTPVILVAYEVPRPDEINESWLLSHAWILRRVLLDDSFNAALDYLRSGFTGAEVGVEVLRAQWETQMRVVAEIRDNVSTHKNLRDAARESLRLATETVAGRDGLYQNIAEALYPSGPEEKDVLEARLQSAQQVLDWAGGDLESSDARLREATTALRQATDDYLAALKEQLNRRTAIDQLRIHVKQNILYYMQAIWRAEPRDQRYFRLYDRKIAWPEMRSPVFSVSAIAQSGPLKPFAPKGESWLLKFPPAKLGTERLLHQVADVDGLLGFRGNYGIFPLKETNALTDYMSQDFLDSYFGVADPDPLGEMLPASEALELAKCAWNRAGTTDEDRRALTQWLSETLAAQRRVAEEVVVPTGQLYIEALPGATPLLEDFKLKHRAVDVAMAESNLDLQLIEALRRTSRLASGDLSDPKVDRHIRIDGGATPVVDADPAPGVGT